MESWSESICKSLVLELNAVTDGEEENELKSSLSYEVKSVIVSPELEGESDVEL